MRRLILVLMGVMLLTASMVHAEETEGNYTRAEAINAVNTLTAAELDALPISGLGPTMASNIVDNRPYVVIEDLGIVSGISVPDGVYYQNILTYFWGADMIPNDEGGDPEPAGDVDETGSVSVSAIIAGDTLLSVTDQSGDGALPFGTITEQYQKAPEYIAVDAVSNYGSWAIEIYTDNFATVPDPAVWGYAYGGLVDIANVQKIPLGWAAFDVETPAESTGNPAELNRWTYVKDKSDIDDPSTAGNDESWAARGGYTNVAFGGPGYAKVVNPYVEGGDDLTAMPFYVYLETAGTAAPGDYTGTMYFDLYHE